MAAENKNKRTVAKDLEKRKEEREDKGGGGCRKFGVAYSESERRPSSTTSPPIRTRCASAAILNGILLFTNCITNHVLFDLLYFEMIRKGNRTKSSSCGQDVGVKTHHRFTLTSRIRL